MAAEDAKVASEKADNAPERPQIPDYLASPNAVFGDKDVQWRYGRAPDYTKTRKVWAEGKTMNHAPGSLEEMVENLVKNWEVEASFKPRLSDWRTIDHENYSFAMGGGPPQTAEHMIKVGTYNGIIAPNEYYSPENSDFASSHKTFKRMMPTFAWEVLEVYSGPPRVSFRWRHWGVMKNDYVGFNNKGEKVTAKAHGGLIDIEGVTVAEVDDKVRLRAIQTWMDPLEMFRQIAPYGIVNKQTMNRKVDMETALDDDTENAKEASQSAPTSHDTSQDEQTSTSTSEPSPEAEPKSTGQGEGSKEPGEAYLGQTAASTTSTQQTPSRPVTTGVTDPVAPQSDSNARSIVESAAAQGDDRVVEKPASNAPQESEVISPSEHPITTTTSPTTVVPNDNSNKSNDSSSSNKVPRSIYSSSITGREEDIIRAAAHHQPHAVEDKSAATGTYDALNRHLDGPADQVHPHQPKWAERSVGPGKGEAVLAGRDTEETRRTHEEMSAMAPGECPFLMNRE